jgi:hypothetical protein
MRNHLVRGNPELTLQALNQLVHCAHNTGWAFNKFIPEQTMSQSARDPISALVLCAPLLYRAQRLLARHPDHLSRHFVRSSVIVTIPEGDPNYIEIESDGERR